MTPQDVLQRSVESGHAFTRAQLSDLSDAELLVRPVPSANHIAWQLGHMIAGTHRMLTGLGQQGAGPARRLRGGLYA